MKALITTFKSIFLNKIIPNHRKILVIILDGLPFEYKSLIKAKEKYLHFAELPSTTETNLISLYFGMKAEEHGVYGPCMRFKGKLISPLTLEEIPSGDLLDINPKDLFLNYKKSFITKLIEEGYDIVSVIKWDAWLNNLVFKGNVQKEISFDHDIIFYYSEEPDHSFHKKGKSKRIAKKILRKVRPIILKARKLGYFVTIVSDHGFSRVRKCIYLDLPTKLENISGCERFTFVADDISIEGKEFEVRETKEFYKSKEFIKRVGKYVLIPKKRSISLLDIKFGVKYRKKGDHGGIFDREGILALDVRDVYV